jgi:signal transduction histidine kinase
MKSADMSLHFHSVEGVSNIEADPALIANAVLNLLVNAKDATPSDGVIQIRVDTHRLPGNLAYQSENAPVAGSLCTGITVQDSGEGFSKEALSHLFEPFFLPR